MHRNIWVLALAAVCFSGCCWVARRSCFPACPPPRIVQVEHPCKLPGPLMLPAVHRVVHGCPDAWACYDTENAAALAQRTAQMKDWIVAARARCETGVSPNKTRVDTSPP